MIVKSRKIGHDFEPIKLLNTFEDYVFIESYKFILIKTTINLNIMDFNDMLNLNGFIQFNEIKTAKK